MALEKQANEEVSSRRRTWIVVLAIAVAVVLLAAFVSLHRGDVPIRADKAERTNISASISTNGKIEPVNNFEAHAPAPATVKKIFVKEGQQVKAGQMLLQLDDSDARKQAAQAQAQIREAEANLAAVEHGGTHEEVLTTRSELDKAKADLAASQRSLQALQNLQKTGAASAGEVADAQSRVQVAQSQVNLLQQKLSSRYSGPEVARVQAQLEQARVSYAAAEELLKHTNVSSTVTGAVYSLPVRQGTYVNAGDLLVQVADLSKVQVRAFVDEPDIGRLASGEPVTVEWDALPARSWTGKVTQVPTTVVKNQTRTVGEALCTVDNSDRKLLPNVNVNVTIVTAQKENVLTVPREAVHQEDGERYVYQVENGRLQKRVIETGISNLTSVEVTKGLPDNAQVALGAVTGAPLRAGLDVRVVQP